MHTIAAPARTRLRYRDRVHLRACGRGGNPPSRMPILVAADSTAVLAATILYTPRVLTNHRIGEVAFVTKPLLVLTILQRGETSTQVIRFVLIHTFNIAHN